jgi:general nucleoside transport system permease protein
MNAPRLAFQRRTIPSGRVAVGVKIAGALLAVLIAGLVLEAGGRPSLDLASAALDYNLGSWFGIEETLLLAAPIVTGALAVYLCFRMRIWNIGIDGQMLMGGAAATAVGLNVDLPTGLALLLMAIAGAAAGAIWVLVPALLKAYLQINEIITTLLLNLVAFQLVVFLAIEVWSDTGVGVRASRTVSYELPMLSLGLDVGVLLPLVVAAVMGIVFLRGRWGYEVSMAGANARAARGAGIEVRRRVISVMLCSGAIAGLSGMTQVAGRLHALSEDVAANAGLYGFIVAALAGISIIAVVVVGILIAGLLHSGISLATEGVSTDVVVAIYGLILLFAGVGDVAGRYRLRARPEAAEEPATSPAAVSLKRTNAEQMAE